MTKEEILKAADEAVEMFAEFVDNREDDFLRKKCAILHYEDIVERDKVLFTKLAGIQERNLLSMRECSRRLIENESILTELKSRL